MDEATDTQRPDARLDDPEHIAIARELVSNRLYGLEDTERKLFLARFVEGETPAEIARRWKISPAAMRMRLMRLRHLLRSHMEEDASNSRTDSVTLDPGSGNQPGRGRQWPRDARQRSD